MRSTKWLPVCWLVGLASTLGGLASAGAREPYAPDTFERIRASEIAPLRALEGPSSPVRGAGEPTPQADAFRVSMAAKEAAFLGESAARANRLTDTSITGPESDAQEAAQVANAQARNDTGFWEALQAVRQDPRRQGEFGVAIPPVGESETLPRSWNYWAERDKHEAGLTVEEAAFLREHAVSPEALAWANRQLPAIRRSKSVCELAGPANCLAARAVVFLSTPAGLFTLSLSLIGLAALLFSVGRNARREARAGAVMRSRGWRAELLAAMAMAKLLKVFEEVEKTRFTRLAGAGGGFDSLPQRRQRQLDICLPRWLDRLRVLDRDAVTSSLLADSRESEIKGRTIRALALTKLLEMLIAEGIAADMNDGGGQFPEQGWGSTGKLRSLTEPYPSRRALKKDEDKIEPTFESIRPKSLGVMRGGPA